MIILEFNFLAPLFNQHPWKFIQQIKCNKILNIINIINLTKGSMVRWAHYLQKNPVIFTFLATDIWKTFSKTEKYGNSCDVRHISQNAAYSEG